MIVCAASNNAGKLKELRRILERMGHEVKSLRDLGIDLDPEETGTTFAENARIKAEAFCKASGLPTVADDSGLCTDALHGAPGVYSARYAGHHGDDDANNAKLLRELADVPEEQRGAKFVSAVCFILPDGRHLKQFYYGSGHLLSIALDGLTVTDFTRDALHRETSRTLGALGSHTQYDVLGRLSQRTVFSGTPQRQGALRWRQTWTHDFRNNLVREERDRNPFDATRWVYDATGKLQGQEDSRTGGVDWPQDPAGNPLDGLTEGRVLHNRVTALNGIRWTYDIHGRTVEKVQGQQRWRYRYDTEHRLTEVISGTRLW